MKKCMCLELFACLLLLSMLSEGATAQKASPTASSYIAFDVPGADCRRGTGCIQPVGVNAQGTVAGIFNDTDHGHGFYRLTDGTVATFDAPGAFCVECARVCAKSFGRDDQL